MLAALEYRPAKPGRTTRPALPVPVTAPVPAATRSSRTATQALRGLHDCFAGIEDPRGPYGKRYDLPEVLTIALCAVLAGGQTAVDMAIFAEAKRDFLGNFLQLRNGVPSHDTFSRVFRQLDPDQFRACFQRFMVRFREPSGGVIAIDGKRVRPSRDPAHPGSACYMISAWCCDTRRVLAQIPRDGRTGESAAVAQLLGALRLRGRIVTTDAINCQRDIAHRVVERGGDYVLALKGNHSALHADVARFFATPRHQRAAGHIEWAADHGRLESRSSLVATDIGWLQARYRWPGLAAIGRVVRTRRIVEKAGARESTETAYYLLSTPLSGQRLGQVVRAHWSVENRLHWVLNVVMNEDRVTSHRDNSPYNLAILRHMALNLMHKDRTKVSLRGKFNLAGWRDDFLVKLLAQA
jgi:predicted transposase YbfD/YdcC